jgi:hypothetical protein
VFLFDSFKEDDVRVTFRIAVKTKLCKIAIRALRLSRSERPADSYLAPPWSQRKHACSGTLYSGWVRTNQIKSTIGAATAIAIAKRIAARKIQSCQVLALGCSFSRSNIR